MCREVVEVKEVVVLFDPVLCEVASRRSVAAPVSGEALRIMIGDRIHSGRFEWRSKRSSLFSSRITSDRNRIFQRVDAVSKFSTI